MRLAPNEVQAIQRSVAELLPEGAVVRLFGSRVDDAKRGGDIDLLVETPEPLSAMDWTDRRARLVARIQRRLEERRIDIVHAVLGVDDPRPVVRNARAHGIDLGSGPQ